MKSQPIPLPPPASETSNMQTQATSERANNLVTTDLPNQPTLAPVTVSIPETEQLGVAPTFTQKLLCALTIVWVSPLIALAAAELYTQLFYHQQTSGNFFDLFTFLQPLQNPIGLVVHIVAFGLSALILRFLPFSRKYVIKSDKKLNINSALIIYILAQTPLLVAWVVFFVLVILGASAFTF